MSLHNFIAKAIVVISIGDLVPKLAGLCYKNKKAIFPIPTNGLVAYYPFNGNANDVSGNNLNGTYPIFGRLKLDDSQNLNILLIS